MLLRFLEASAWDLKVWRSLVDKKQKHQQALKELNHLGWDELRFTVQIHLCSMYSRGTELSTFLGKRSVTSQCTDQQAHRASLALFTCLPKVKVHVIPELARLRQHNHSGMDSNSFSSFLC